MRNGTSKMTLNNWIWKVEDSMRNRETDLR